MKDDSLDAVVYDGIRFLESLTAHYGAEKGMEVWNAMGDAVGREVKGKIFFAMMTGETGGRVRFSAAGAQQSNAVAVIKTIRNYTGLGLKEAKDIWDASKTSQQVVTVGPEKRRDLAKDLRNLGCMVS